MQSEMREFYKQAGQLAVKHVRELLGSDELGLTLSPAYAEEKPRRARFTRLPGKTADQPLILSTDMYDAVGYAVSGNGVRIGFIPRDESGRFARFSGAEVFRYGNIWDERLQFISRGVEHAMPEIEEALQVILNRIAQRMVAD